MIASRFLRFRIVELISIATFCLIFTLAAGHPIRSGSPNPEIVGTGDFWMQLENDRIGLRFNKEQHCAIDLLFPAKKGGDLNISGLPHWSDPNMYKFAGINVEFNTEGTTDFEMDPAGQVFHGATVHKMDPLRVTGNALHVSVTFATLLCAVEIFKGKVVDAAAKSMAKGWPTWATIVCVVGGVAIIAIAVGITIWLCRRQRRLKCKSKKNADDAGPSAIQVDASKAHVPATPTPTPTPPPPSLTTPQPTPPPVPSSSVVAVPPPAPSASLLPSNEVPTAEATASSQPTPLPAPSTEATPPPPAKPVKASRTRRKSSRARESRRRRPSSSQQTGRQTSSSGSSKRKKKKDSFEELRKNAASWRKKYEEESGIAGPKKTTSINEDTKDDKKCCDRLADATGFSTTVTKRASYERASSADGRGSKTPSADAVHAPTNKKANERRPAKRSGKRKSTSKDEKKADENGKKGTKRKGENATLATVPPADAPSDLPFSDEAQAPANNAPPPPRLRRRTASEDDKANPALVAFDETEERGNLQLPKRN